MRRTLSRVVAPLAAVACALFVLGPSSARAEGEAEAAPGGEQLVRNTYERVVVERTERVEKQVTVVARKPKPKYSAAIFVANRAKRAGIDDEKVLVMQDFLTGHVTNLGYQIIAREDVINAVAKLAGDGPNKGDKRLPGEELDEMLSNNTSALALARNMNADFVLMVTISSFATDKQRYTDRARGIDLVGLTHKMRATYRLLDTTVGGSQTAGVATATIKDRLDPDKDAIVREGLVDDLLEASSMDLARMMGDARRSGSVEEAVAANPAKGDGLLEIHCSVQDMFFPEIEKDENGRWTVLANRYRLESMSVTVEMDGVVIGTTPGPFVVKPGLHKLRLRRPKFKDESATINVMVNKDPEQPQRLTFALAFTDAGRLEFGEMTRFIQELKQGAILNEAQAKMWEGYAKQLEQSGVRIQKNINVNRDTKRDVKVDVEERTGGAAAPAPADKNDLRKQVVGDEDEAPAAAPKARPAPRPEPPAPAPDRDEH